MNVFAEIARPIMSRPGDFPVVRPRMEGYVDNPWGLTGRECQVLQLIVACNTGKETAMALGLTLKTIEIHTIKLRKKMGARSSVEAALMWDRLQRPNGANSCSEFGLKNFPNV